jgi:hypothetical protein
MERGGGESGVGAAPPLWVEVVPQNKMYELQLSNRFMTNQGAVVTWMFPAGTPLPSRDPSTYPKNGWRFRITNYGKTAIINIYVTFDVEFNGKKTSVAILPVFSIASANPWTYMQ